MRRPLYWALLGSALLGMLAWLALDRNQGEPSPAEPQRRSEPELTAEVGLQPAALKGLEAASTGSTEREASRPKDPNQRQAATVEHQLTLHGILLNEVGRGVLGDRVSLRVRKPSDGRLVLELLVPTRPNGEFELVWPAAGAAWCALFPAGAESPPSIFELRFLDQSSVPETFATEARVVSLAPDQRRVDLGALYLQRMREACAGRVLDSEGRPVGGARVEAQFLHAGTPREAFTSPQLLATLSGDEDGAFGVWLPASQLEAAGEIDELLVQARMNDGVTSELVTVRVGARDLELRLSQGGHLSGSVVRGAALLDRRLSIVAVREAERERTAPRHATALEVGAEDFELAHLPAGTTELCVYADGLDEPVACVRGLHVLEGQRSSDPRLQPLDLSSASELFWVQVFAPDGTPLHTANAWLRESGCRGPCRKVSIDRGLLLRSGERACLEMWIGGDGARLTRFERACSGDSLRLEPSIEVEIVPGRASLPVGHVLSPRLVRLAPTAEELGFDLPPYVSGSLDAAGRARYALPLGGVYEVTWWVTNSATEACVPLGPTSARRLEIPERAGLQSFALAPDASELARALVEVRAQ